MIQKIRPFIQVLFLGIFLFLMFTGKAQFWMGLIFVSILLSAVFGRFYCGWACPINTLIRPVNWLKKKLGIQKEDIPGFVKKLRWVFFGLFLVGLAYTIYTISQGRKFPLPLIIIPLGLLTTLLINEKSWHRYLCPWGILFSLTGRFAKYGIKSFDCAGCSLCAKSCPGDAIDVTKKEGAVIDSTYCLQCFECQTACPINALSFVKK